MVDILKVVPLKRQPSGYCRRKAKSSYSVHPLTDGEPSPLLLSVVNPSRGQPPRHQPVSGDGCGDDMAGGPAGAGCGDRTETIGRLSDSALGDYDV